MPDGAPTAAPAKETAHRQQPAVPALQGPVLLHEEALPLALSVQRAVVDPGRLRPADVLALQRTAGNRAVSRLIQAELTVGPTNDGYEQEANWVAERVIQMGQSANLQMAGEPGADMQRQEEEEVQTKPLAATITPLVQRQEDEEEIQMAPLPSTWLRTGVQRQEEEEEIQTKALVQRQEEEEKIQTKPAVQPPTSNLQSPDGSFETGPELEARLAARKGGGSPLPDDVRGFMEPRFGADFGGVRLHTGGEAVQLNKELQAQAFTYGQDIYLGAGRCDPGTTAGKRLLAHELTHVVQQTGARHQRTSPFQATAQRAARMVQRAGGSTEEMIRQAMSRRRLAMGYEPEGAPPPLPGPDASETRPQAYTGQDLADKEEAAARLAAVLHPKPAAGPTWQRGQARGEAPRGEFFRGAQPAAPGWQPGQRPAGPVAPGRQFLRGAQPPPPAAPTWQRGQRPGPGAERGGEFLSTAPPSLVMNKAHSRLVSDALRGDPAAQIKQVEKAKRHQLFNTFDQVQLETDDSAHVKDSSGNVVWYRLKGRPNEYIRAAKVLQTRQGAPQVTGPEAESGKAGAATKWAGDLMTEIDERMIERARGLGQMEERIGAGTVTVSDKEQEAIGREGGRLGYAEGAAWAASGILGMAVSWKSIIDGEASAGDRVEAAMNFIASAEGVLGATTQIAAGVAESKLGEEATASQVLSGTSSFALGYQEFFSTLANLVKTIKGGVDMIRAVYEQKAHGQVRSKREWTVSGTGMLTAVLQMLKGVARTARAMNEALGGALTGAFSQVCSAFAVGVDIFIAALKSAMQAYYLAVSAVRGWRMRHRRQELDAELKKMGYTGEQLKAAHEFYGEREAMIATFDGLIATADKQIKAKEERMHQISFEMAGTRFVWRMKRLDKESESLFDELQALRKKKEGYAARKEELGREMQEHESQGRSEGKGAEQSEKAPTRAEMSEMELAGELAYISEKRVLRQAFHLGANAAQIAGSIATYVAGPGAPAAIGFKAAAAGIDASLPFFRAVKQFGRNVAAKNVAAGTSGLSNKIFNADKATVAKLQSRKRYAVTILMMVARLNDLLPRSQDPGTRANELAALKKQAARVEDYILGAGCDPPKLYRANGKPQKQVEILVQELARREFGED